MMGTPFRRLVMTAGVILSPPEADEESLCQHRSYRSAGAFSPASCHRVCQQKQIPRAPQPIKRTIGACWVPRFAARDDSGFILSPPEADEESLCQHRSYRSAGAFSPASCHRHRVCQQKQIPRAPHPIKRNIGACGDPVSALVMTARDAWPRAIFS